MIVVGKKRVLDFMQKYNQSRRVMQSWVQLVEAATWSSLQNLKETCPTADLIKGTNLVVFDMLFDPVFDPVFDLVFFGWFSKSP